MSAYIGIGGVAKSISKMYIGVDGKARQVQKAYIGVNGVARLWYQRGTLLGGYEVGKTVKIDVERNGYDWLVVHQGIPDAGVYDASCNGTWLLMKDIYTTSAFSSNSNSYKDSSIYSYLNGTFFNLFSANIRNAIKQVKIPYTNSNGDVMSGSDGLSCKVFLLSGTEVGFSDLNYMNTEGAKLPYFDSASKRIAYSGSSAAAWWLRSPDTLDTNRVWEAYIDGSGYSGWYRVSHGVRPALILPQDVPVDDTGYVVV